MLLALHGERWKMPRRNSAFGLRRGPDALGTPGHSQHHLNQRTQQSRGVLTPWGKMAASERERSIRWWYLWHCFAACTPHPGFESAFRYKRIEGSVIVLSRLWRNDV
jgi:hypothetical protein